MIHESQTKASPLAPLVPTSKVHPKKLKNSSDTGDAPPSSRSLRHGGDFDSCPDARLNSPYKRASMPPEKEKLGLIAGNGKFPFLVLDAARAQGFEVIVAAIKEETFPEIADRGASSIHWLSLGELSKLIETFQREGVRRAVMAGQVKHKQIFSSIRPDWRLAKLLLSLTRRNTDSLLGAVAKVLAD